MNQRGEALLGLWGKRLIFLDGAMGTLLQAQGAAGRGAAGAVEPLRPQAIKAIHRAYLEAGCDIVTANTLGASREHLGDEAPVLMAAGVRLALERSESGPRLGGGGFGQPGAAITALRGHAL